MSLGQPDPRDLYAVVRDLAATDPIALDNQEEPVCALCRTDDVGSDGWYVDLHDPATHAETCPWRRAKALDGAS